MRDVGKEIDRIHGNMKREFEEELDKMFWKIEIVIALIMLVTQPFIGYYLLKYTVAESILVGVSVAGMFILIMFLARKAKAYKKRRRS